MEQLTPEKRQQILRGSDGLGHEDATRAPRHMQDRIIEIRLAKAEHRDVAPPSAEYIRTAEARMTTLGRQAVDFGKKLPKPISSLRDDIGWQRTVNQALRTQAAITKAEEERKAEAERKAAEDRATAEAVCQSVFPWECRG